MARAVAAADIEAPPEADRLEGFPHPRETASVFGHASAESVLSAALASGHMHHAWLLSGPAGIGKATTAYRFARAALARLDERDLFGGGLDIDPSSATARQVGALSHPGLLLIRRAYDAKAKRFATAISVDEVRRIKSFLAHSADGESRRVVIVDSADELNVNAANALLKSLEEPPPRTIFLLITAAPGRLLATIRSRCRVLSYTALGEGHLRQAVSAALQAAGKNEPADADWPGLAATAGGSVRRALALIENGGLALQARIDKLIQGLPRLDVRGVHALADDLQGAAQEQRFMLFFELFEDTLARLVRAAASGEGGAQDKALAERLIGAARLATFAELWETLARDKADTLALNLDRKSLILACFARLEAAARA